MQMLHRMKMNSPMKSAVRFVFLMLLVLFASGYKSFILRIMYLFCFLKQLFFLNHNQYLFCVADMCMKSEARNVVSLGCSTPDNCQFLCPICNNCQCINKLCYCSENVFPFTNNKFIQSPQRFLQYYINNKMSVGYYLSLIIVFIIYKRRLVF